MLRTHRFLLTTVVALTALVAGAGCGSSGGGEAADPSATTVKPSGPPIVKIGTTKLGPTLVDAAGFTLYVSDSDPDGETTCLDGLCLLTWKALVSTSGSVPVAEGLEQSWFELIPGPNATRIVTVKGRPLYRAASEKKPGETVGHGYGQIWWAVNANGEAYG